MVLKASLQPFQNPPSVFEQTNPVLKIPVFSWPGPSLRAITCAGMLSGRANRHQRRFQGELPPLKVSVVSFFA